MRTRAIGWYKFQRRKLKNTKTEFIMKTISRSNNCAIIGSWLCMELMRGWEDASARGHGHSGHGPSPSDPTQGWYDEMDESVGSPWGNGHSGRGLSKFDPTQGWYDEADESVGRRRLSSSWLYTLATAKLNSECSLK